MKTRYLFTFALTTLLGYLLGPGCTQDFDVFQPCSFGQKVCSEQCVSTADPDFGCGAEACVPCSVANANTICQQGECAIGSCQNPFGNCDDDVPGCETDLASDPQNCRVCGDVCNTPNAEPACVAGNCEIGTCDQGFEDCNDDARDGCEAQIGTDPQHCGDCETQCPPSFSCQAGMCVLVCPMGTGDCDGDASNGCETTFGSTEHCAFCGDACDLANATAACTAGMCAIESCDAGWDDCDGMAANGCEADIEGSAATCGACDNPCPMGPNGTTVCTGGTCELNCNAGFGDCDGDVATGCETDTNETEAHCGGCGQPCALANATEGCNGGACELVMCDAGFGDCNGDPTDGCETSLGSPLHCGMCDNACSFANAAATCMNGMCELGACDPGFADCNAMAADGCEAQTATDPMNCGMCGNACPGGPPPPNMTLCSGGTCGAAACLPGFADCNAMAADGCETSTNTVADCGGCGRACSGANVLSLSCTDGVCDSTCDLGWANCSTPAFPAADNGCEQDADDNSDIEGSNANCGGCGNSCGSQGGPSSSFECDGGAANVVCGCSSTGECQGPGVPQNQASCSGVSGLCSCGPGGNVTQCRPGEWCILSGGASTCSCNGGAACGAGLTCCQTPDGCTDLQADEQSCGACGRACPAGFVCVTGTCRCDAGTDCDAGTGGSFSCNGSGNCVCGANTCAAGERCQPNGQCG